MIYKQKNSNLNHYEIKRKFNKDGKNIKNMLTFNAPLFLLFVVYITILNASLFLNTHAKKRELVREYKKEENAILGLMALTFITNLGALGLLTLYMSNTLYIFSLEVLFVIYMGVYGIKQGRCHRQHAMLIHNFLSIPIIYYYAIYFNSSLYLLLTLPLLFYTFFEFKFAKFSSSQKKIWD